MLLKTKNLCKSMTYKAGCMVEGNRSFVCLGL